MPTTVIGGREIQVNDEGFLTDPTQWSADLATELAALIGQPLTEAHWTLIHFLREDHAVTGETARATSLAAASPVVTVPTRVTPASAGISMPVRESSVPDV